MKIDLRRIALVLSALAITVGCAQELMVPEDIQVSTPKLLAELEEGVATRTVIEGGAEASGALPMLWQPSDEVGVFSSGGSANVRYVNDETEMNVANASFSAAEAVSGEIMYAYYPYSAENDGREATSLVGTVPARQVMGGALSGDYKYGELRSRDEDGGYRFKFHNLFSMVRFKVDVTGSKLENKVLEKITLKVTREDGTVPAVTGSFTFSAADGSYTLGETSNMLSTIWNKELEAEFSDFATVFPEIKEGDKLTFTLSTGESNTIFSVTSKVDFQPGTYYTFPLKLAVFEKNPTKYGYAEKARPTITGFKFEVAKNSGKLLNNQTVWSSNKPKFSEVKEHVATISDTSSVDVMIPYLYDFTLVPTFSAGGNVTVGSQAVTSGSTAVDFTGGVTLTVNTEDEARDYTVNVRNTGLPVVVLKQSGSGDFDKVYQGGVNLPFVGNVGGTLVNEFVDFMIRGKETTWVEDDQITVYNADGSVNMPTTNCGARLRGNTSQAYPKKPFAVKLTSKQSILGMPKHKRWVLLANWLDHSMIRNTVAFDVAHAIEKAWKTGAIEPGIPWNVHGQNVELVFVESDGTGHHVGNYYLCEQIKIDGNRLDIQDPYEDVDNPTFETCGYLLEVDNVEEEIPFMFETSNGVPFKFKDDVFDNTLLNKVKTKVQGIEDNIDSGNFTAAYNDLDINSVIDQLFIWELTMNREYGDPRSVYMYMDGNGKLSAGPVWDFDRGTFQNTTNAKSQGNSDRVKPYNEWMYWRTAETASESYIWYKQLAKDPIFVAAAQARWAVIYPQLQLVSAQIREYGRTMKASFEVDSKMWPTDKSSIQAHKSKFSDWSGDENINDWGDLIENFVTVYEARLEGMNTLITSGKFVK